MSKIMIIEDELSIRKELSILLSSANYDVYAAEVFSDIVRQVQNYDPDLILLDINLPDYSGYNLCTDIRRISKVPIIFVTSLNTSIDELNALSLGGDDFITKPYNVPILLARIQVILRRNSKEPQEILDIKGLHVDLLKSSAEYNGNLEELTKNEIKILCCLYKNPGTIVPRADIIEYLWDNQVYIDDNTLSVNMTRLRGKLKQLGLEEIIQTKRGMGYKI